MSRYRDNVEGGVDGLDSSIAYLLASWVGEASMPVQ